MQLTDAVQRLKDHEADLKKMGLNSLYVFGSTLRGNQRAGSDVDLFFDYDRDERTGLTIFRLMDIEDRAARILGCKVDIMTRDSLHPLIRKSVENAAMQVF